MTADKQHLHHRLLEIGHSHRRAVLIPRLERPAGRLGGRPLLHRPPEGPALLPGRGRSRRGRPALAPLAPPPGHLAADHHRALESAPRWTGSAWHGRRSWLVDSPSTSTPGTVPRPAAGAPCVEQAVPEAGARPRRYAWPAGRRWPPRPPRPSCSASPGGPPAPRGCWARPSGLPGHRLLLGHPAGGGGGRPGPAGADAAGGGDHLRVQDGRHRPAAVPAQGHDRLRPEAFALALVAGTVIYLAAEIRFAMRAKIPYVVTDENKAGSR